MVNRTIWKSLSRSFKATCSGYLFWLFFGLVCRRTPFLVLVSLRYMTLGGRLGRYFTTECIQFLPIPWRPDGRKGRWLGSASLIPSPRTLNVKWVILLRDSVASRVVGTLRSALGGGRAVQWQWWQGSSHIISYLQPPSPSFSFLILIL